MAPAIYPQEPGSEYGLCEEMCGHLDCGRSRRDAAQICRRCKNPIGYGRLTYFDGDRPNEYGEAALIHAACEERHVRRVKKRGRK